MTDAEMAAALRAKGWVCRELVGEEMPEPKVAVGQVWASPISGVQPRTIVQIVYEHDIRYSVPGKAKAACYAEFFLRWARKTGARPL